MSEVTKVKNIPTVFVIFGATGDLMAKKITPALFHLYIKGKLPKLFKIVGFSRREYEQADFLDHIKKILVDHKEKFKREDIDGFLNYFVYQKGGFDDFESYKIMAEFLGNTDGVWNVCSNKLFYLAVPPQNYEQILRHLSSSGLTLPCGPDEGWTRVIVEKPFGRDAATAQKLDTMLGELFREEQIYRIDHYLGKEMTQNILSFRFNNDLFEDLWNAANIEKIEINFLEKIGVETRADFYDGIGALRDVGQNHVLQLLALITMDKPDLLNAESVRQARASVLNELRTLTSGEISELSYRAQYDGYKSLPGVGDNSTTETYFKSVAYLDNNRWKGVPIVLSGGKMIEDRKEIVVTFKHKMPCFCKDKHYKNKITFTISPKEGISIDFWAKKPGLDFNMEKQKFYHLFRDARKKAQYTEEYEKLLLDCILGNQLLFVSTEEVASMWNYIDPIIRAWDEGIVKLDKYKSYSKIPLNNSKNIDEKVLE